MLIICSRYVPLGNAGLSQHQVRGALSLFPLVCAGNFNEKESQWIVVFEKLLRQSVSWSSEHVDEL